jgi:hypothetical protein
MNNQNDITIPYCDLDDAVENIISDRYLEYDERVNRDSIKKVGRLLGKNILTQNATVLKEHLEYAIENILSEPSEHFKSNRKFWNDLENSVYLDDVA